MTLTYDFDIHWTVPQDAFHDAAVGALLQQTVGTPNARRNYTALFRDPVTVQALLGADAAVRDLFVASGFALAPGSSGLAPGEFHIDEDVARTDVVARLSENIPKFPLRGANLNGFDFAQFLEVVVSAKPVSGVQMVEVPPEERPEFEAGLEEDFEEGGGGLSAPELADEENGAVLEAVSSAFAQAQEAEGAAAEIKIPPLAGAPLEMSPPEPEPRKAELAPIVQEAAPQPVLEPGQMALEGAAGAVEMPQVEEDRSAAAPGAAEEVFAQMGAPATGAAPQAPEALVGGLQISGEPIDLAAHLPCFGAETPAGERLAMAKGPAVGRPVDAISEPIARPSRPARPERPTLEPVDLPTPSQRLRIPARAERTPVAMPKVGIPNIAFPAAGVAGKALLVAGVSLVVSAGLLAGLGDGPGAVQTASVQAAAPADGVQAMQATVIAPVGEGVTEAAAQTQP